MQFIRTSLPHVILIEPKVFTDERGFFLESYQKERFVAAGIQADFVQDNHSASTKGVLRGLHFQNSPNAQGKLVRVMKGAVLDVAVDLRRESPYFGKWVSIMLSESNKWMYWIPEGFAHGFQTLDVDDRVNVVAIAGPQQFKYLAGRIVGNGTVGDPADQC